MLGVFYLNSLKLEDRFVGMPDSIFRSDDNKIYIESISLKGNGIDRILQPMRGEYINDNDYLISRTDYSYNEYFGLYGLPEGDDRLTVKAEGYKTIVKNYTVTPGIPKIDRITELEPE